MDVEIGLLAFPCSRRGSSMKKLFRQRHCGFTELVYNLFGTVLQFVEFFRSEALLGCDVTKLLRPLGVHVEATGGLSHRFCKGSLSFLRQQPVDEHFRSVGMRGILEDREIAAAAGRVITFFNAR